MDYVYLSWKNELLEGSGIAGDRSNKWGDPIMVDLPSVSQWIKDRYSSFVGLTSGKYMLIASFTSTLSENDKRNICLYWNSLTNESAEAAAYKPLAQRMSEAKAARDAARVSAMARLKVLGMSDEEINSIVGVD